MIASSMVQLGLSWWQSWICVWIGYGVVAPFIALNARPGAIFHVTFPVVARTSFGVYGSLWCTFNRGAMAWCVTYINIKTWLILAQCVVWCSGEYWW
jgi:NCS1 family nucleobase:cation symporter-1